MNACLSVQLCVSHLEWWRRVERWTSRAQYLPILLHYLSTRDLRCWILWQIGTAFGTSDSTSFSVSEKEVCYQTALPVDTLRCLMPYPTIALCIWKALSDALTDFCCRGLLTKIWKHQWVWRVPFYQILFILDAIIHHSRRNEVEIHSSLLISYGTSCLLLINDEYSLSHTHTFPGRLVATIFFPSIPHIEMFPVRETFKFLVH